MSDRNSIKITVDYAHENEQWIAELRLREYRCGSQYGATVVWTLKGGKAKYYTFMRRVCKVIAKEVLPIIP